MPTRDENRRQWNERYDWSDLGESWTPDDRWRRAILDGTLGKYLQPGKRLLEIGPGGGRWTQELLRSEPARLDLVDLAQKPLDLCRERFGAAHPELGLHLGDGASLPFIADGSIDFIWSFDVFVHVERPEVLGYFEEFARVLAPKGMGIVHYATIDRAQCDDPRSGWRSDFRSADMRAILEATGFRMLEDIYDKDISHTNSSIVIFDRAPRS